MNIRDRSLMVFFSQPSGDERFQILVVKRFGNIIIHTRFQRVSQKVASAGKTR
ncbi:MAG: hypothetical protein ACPG5T_00725 [Endozoicomonas sp.]